MLETAEVMRQCIQAMIHIIGRKTSEEYAIVTIRKLLQTLHHKYPFLQAVDVRNTQFLEFAHSVTVQESLNTVQPKRAGAALKDLMQTIINSLGKTAGYFFIRELKEKIGPSYDMVLMRTMDVDLSALQATSIVEKQTVDLLHIEQADVLRRVLKTLIEVLEKQTSKAFAIEFMTHRVDAVRQQHSFLEYVKINDIRYTLGANEVIVQPDMNAVDALELGKAIQMILQETENALTMLGRTSILESLRTHLTAEYLLKLEEMKVSITAPCVGYDAVFKQVIRTLVEVLGRTSTEEYAIYTVNSFLRKTDGTYGFLKNVHIQPAVDEHDIYQVTIMTNLDDISESDARRALQALLELVVETLGNKLGTQFIQEFKNSLEKKYLLKIEEIGVNLHMIELSQSFTTRSDETTVV